MRKLILIAAAALAVAACKGDEDAAGGGSNGSTNVFANAGSGTKGGGFSCWDDPDTGRVCRINDSGMGPPRPASERRGIEHSNQGRNIP